MPLHSLEAGPFVRRTFLGLKFSQNKFLACSDPVIHSHGSFSACDRCQDRAKHKKLVWLHVDARFDFQRRKAFKIDILLKSEEIVQD